MLGQANVKNWSPIHRAAFANRMGGHVMCSKGAAAGSNIRRRRGALVVQSRRRLNRKWQEGPASAFPFHVIPDRAKMLARVDALEVRHRSGGKKSGKTTTTSLTATT